MTIAQEIITTDKPVKLANGSVINRFSHVLAGADIAENVMIGEHCYIAKDAQIGPNSRVQNHVNVWDGVRIGANVFIGPRVTFTNDHDPSEARDDFVPDITMIDTGACICAGVGIVAPCVIGKNAFIGAFSRVFRDVKKGERVWGKIK